MSDTDICSVDSWEVLDSRGTPTVACSVTLAGGARGKATVPSGASTGRHEAHELRDGDERYAGRGVRRAVHHVRTTLARAVAGLDATDQRTVDARLREADGTDNLSRLGANATLAVSIATALAAADSRDTPLWRSFTDDPLLPLPMINIISGGAHAGGLIDVQDLLVVPIGATSFAEAIEWVARIRRATAKVAAAHRIDTALVADEGGLSAALPTNRAALELLDRGIQASGLTGGTDVAIAIDVAATQLIGTDGSYRLRAEGRRLCADELIEEIVRWTRDFPIVSVEDPLAEDDWPAWRRASSAMSDIQLLGDDLFVTDQERLHRGIRDQVANAVLVKVNQNGTLTGAHDVHQLAQSAGYATVVSARSGDTEDAWLADLAVGWRSGQIKVGSTTRAERTAKWNRLLEIEHHLGDRARYAGGQALHRHAAPSRPPTAPGGRP